MTTTTTTTTTTLLRKLFPDRSTVMIYPDDFYYYDNNNDEYPNQQEQEQEQETVDNHTRLFLLKKDLSIPELINRHSGHFSDRRVAILLRPPPNPNDNNPPPPSSLMSPFPDDDDYDDDDDDVHHYHNNNNNNNIYHDLHIPVGYWTQVVGLGRTPTQVTLTGQLGVYAVPANTANPNVGSLDTFWRSCENLCSQTTFLRDNTTKKWCVPVNTTTGTDTGTDTDTDDTEMIPVGDLTDPEWGYPPDQVPPSSIDPSKGMVWAVSQAAPLRRICIGGTSTSSKSSSSSTTPQTTSTTTSTTKDGDDDSTTSVEGEGEGEDEGSGGGGPTLHLSLGPNCASGGYMSNCLISNGYVSFGSQQQWCCRNSTIGHKAAGGAWSFVLVGCCSSPSSSLSLNSGGESSSSGLGTRPTSAKVVEWAKKPGLDLPLISNELKTPVRIEKPFLFIDRGDEDNGERDEMLYLGIPDIQHDSVGADHRPMSHNERVPIFLSSEDEGDCDVKVITPDDPFDDIQSAVLEGKHLVLNPGTYRWEQTLCLSPTTERQVILGIGMATIQAPSINAVSTSTTSTGSGGSSVAGGRPCIYVPSSSRGVRISGLSLEASRITTDDSEDKVDNYSGSCLLQWGDPVKPKQEETKKGPSTDPPNNPPPSSSWDRPSGAIHDLYCFVGGRSLDRNVSVETMVKIYSSHVVGDNLWLWRADHVKLKPGEQPNRPELSEYHVTTYGECRCDVGLEVYGNNVIMYGLAVEHTYKDMVRWYGHHGSVYFYQSELPYDVSGDVYNNHQSEGGVAGYKVQSTAQYHTAKGVGVYSYFRDYDDVNVPSGVHVHDATTGRYENIFTVWLNGYQGLKSVINGRGEATHETGTPCVVPVYISGASSSCGWGTGLIPSIWPIRIIQSMKQVFFPTTSADGDFDFKIASSSIVDTIRTVFSSAWKLLLRSATTLSSSSSSSSDKSPKPKV